MIMLLIMICGFLPALNLVGEKEKGTIEQINVTPVDRFTFTLAKLVPYWVIGLVLLAFAMLLAWVVYGLVPMGSFGAICLAAALFILTMSGIGVVIANNSDTMQQAMFVMFFFVMLFVLMSGLVTPVESMPGWAQWITRFLPPLLFRGDHACRLPQGYDVRRIVGRLCRAGRFCVRVRVAGGPDLPQADVTARRVRE